MESSSFYVQLPSNASMDLYPSNKLCCYKTQLPRTLNFDGKYEVGLVEIQYPNTWKTFRHDHSYEIRMQYMPNFGNENFTWDAVERARCEIPKAQYETFSELIETVERAINKEAASHGWGRRIISIFDMKVERKLAFVIAQDFHIRFSEEFRSMVGGLDEYVYHTGRIETKQRYDLQNGFHSLYVYSDICEPQFVGDVMAPLLRTVALRGKRGEYISKIFDVPHYIPVALNGINSIEINIKDDTGEDVSFLDGKVVCKLHFRPKTI